MLLILNYITLFEHLLYHQIEDLVEQLEQFRDEIVNKEDEISQLQLQLEVASREQDSGRENFEEQLTSALAENAELKVNI